VNELDRLRNQIEESKNVYSKLHDEMKNFSKSKHQLKAEPEKRFFGNFFQTSHETNFDKKHKLLNYSYIDYKANLLSKYSNFNLIKGIYVYGTPGCGKTFLMEMFYDHCPVKKLKTHFNLFMLDVHQRLHKLKVNVLN
jgi:protein AFG1